MILPAVPATMLDPIAPPAVSVRLPISISVALADWSTAAIVSSPVETSPSSALLKA